MVIEQKFPLELLQGTRLEKLDYFKYKVIVPHRNLREILKQLLNNILYPTDAFVYLVFGITGVGKTTLDRGLKQMLLSALLDDLRANPGQIAVAGIEVRPTQRGKFDYILYYSLVLEELNEVLINYKVGYGIPEVNENCFEPKDAKSRNARTLRRAMEKVFIHRRLKSFLLDEAQHLLAIPGSRQMLEQMNWIKSIANVTQTVHVLFGSYELLNCPTLNGQLGRRSEDFHFAPYEKENKADYGEFGKVALTFAQYMPLQKLPDFENRIDYFIDYSNGCIGAFHSWLYRSFRACVDGDCTSLTSHHLKQGELPAYKRKQIREELTQGKRRLAELLCEENMSSVHTQQEESQLGGRKYNNLNVGQRNPKRDPVGVNYYDNSRQ